MDDDGEPYAEPDPAEGRRRSRSARDRLRPRGRSGSSERPPRERRTRPPRGPRGPRTGGGAGGAAAILQKPAAKIGIVLILLILLVVILARVISGCQRDQLVDSYRDYLDNGAGQVATESATMGRQLLEVMRNQQRRNANALQVEVRRIATRARDLVTRAEELDPPGSLETANNSLVSVLSYRANGLEALAVVLPQVISSDDQAFGSATIAERMQRFLASDVIYIDQFREPARAALEDDDVDGIQVPDSVFLAGQAENLAAPVGARQLLPGLKRSGGTTTQPGSPPSPPGQGNAHGTGLVKTVAIPEQKQLEVGATTSVAASDRLMWQVTVENQGDFTENGITVRVTFTASDSPGSPDIKETQIDTIAPGEQAVVDVPGPSNPNFDVQATLKVEVVPLPEERRTENNSADYPVVITFD